MSLCLVMICQKSHLFKIQFFHTLDYSMKKLNFERHELVKLNPLKGWRLTVSMLH